MTFHVGQKVACIDDQNFVNDTDGDSPVKGRIYHIRGFSPASLVLLEEVVNRKANHALGFYEGGYFPHRFRPVVERKTSIEIFQKMLTPSKVNA